MSDNTESLDDAWRHVLSEFDARNRAWVATSKALTVHDATVMIAVPNEFTRENIESRLRNTIEQSLSDYYSRPMRLAITIEQGLELDLATPDHPAEPELEIKQLVPRPTSHLIARNSEDIPTTSPDSAAQHAAEYRLNAKYTFDNFVSAESNRFAHAAARAAAEQPGKAYNPLVIYGDSGLGKTHLLHALGHYVLDIYENVRVKYVSTEELTNDFINAISTNRTNEFRSAYRQVDVLLIDDIQFLQSKTQTQEEFFHTFDTLYNAQRQIVMTCDRPPKELEALEPRLRSRFEMGLITDIQPPVLETRIAILRRKAALEHLDAPAEVLEFIASRIKTNVRELEGALIRVTAYASLNRENLDLSLAEVVLKDLIPDGQGETEVNAQRIIAETARYFNIGVDDLTGTSRTKTMVTARQIAMYLCRELTELSLPKIGHAFGKDHSTVMHADSKIRTLMSERRSVYNQVTELTNRIKSSQ